MVKRVFELLEELKILLKDHGKHDLLEDFNEEGFPERLAYLADIFEALNDLNRKMQGKELNIIHHVEAIKGFLAKLSPWKTRIEKGIYTSFSNLFNVVGESEISEELKVDIINHLRDLGEEFQRYLDADLDTKHGTMCMTRNHYCCDVNDIPIELQGEFLDLQMTRRQKTYSKSQNCMIFGCK